MRRGIVTAIAAGCMTLAVSMTAFAGEWKQDETGWWYQEDDGSYQTNAWDWIDGRCYYFNEVGYCLLDTTTPDGYTVDASGAWTVDGVVQTQAAEAGETQTGETQTGETQTGGTQTGETQTGETQTGETQATETQAAETQTAQQIRVSDLTVTIPDGFHEETALTEETSVFFSNEDETVMIAVTSEAIPDMEGYESLLESMSETIMDQTMDSMGTVTEKSTHQYTSGTWYRYRLSDADAETMGIPGQFYAYARISNTNVQIVIFAGDLSGVDMDGIMNNCLR